MAAERDRQRPDVRPGADVDVKRHLLARIRDDVERVHPRAPHRHLHLDAAPREPVRTLTADLHRGCGGDRQLDLTAEALEQRLQLALAGRCMALDDLSLRIPGGRSRGEVDFRAVALVPAYEPRRDLS